MATKYEYYDAGDSAGEEVYASTKWIAQTFTPATAHTITSVKLLMYRIGSPGTVTVKIQGVDGSGHPDGSDDCSGTTDADTLTTNTAGEWREITLGAGSELAASTQYAIVLHCAGADGDNKPCFRKDHSGASYAGGNDEYSTNSGSSWSANTDSDYMFEDWGDPLGAPAQAMHLMRMRRA